MSAEAIDVKRNTFIASAQARVRESAISWAGFMVAAVAVLIASLTLALSMAAVYIANDAKEKADTYEIYVNNLNAYLKSIGVDVPPPPEEE